MSDSLRSRDASVESLVVEDLEFISWNWKTHSFFQPTSFLDGMESSPVNYSVVLPDS